MVNPIFRVVITFITYLTLGISASQGATLEYIDEIEKDFPLRQVRPLDITNVKGDITVQGWVFDKVRVKIRKKILSDSPMKAKQLFSGIDYRFTSTDKNLEITSQYGKDLSIEERLREKENPKVKLEMLISAPTNLKLHLWVVNGKVSLKNWSGTAEIRANTGTVRVENFKGDTVSVLCEACSAQFKQIRGSVRSMTGQGSVDLNQVQGKTIYVETDSGPMHLFEIKGDQLYTSKQGAIDGRFLSGKVEFHTENALVDLKEVTGFLSGYSEKGTVRAQVRTWKFLDQAMIETVSGDIFLTFPRRFSANVDVWSKQGQADVGFPVGQGIDNQSVGPQPLGRMTGRIREGGGMLRIFSETGNIKIYREAL